LISNKDTMVNVVEMYNDYECEYYSLQKVLRRLLEVVVGWTVICVRRNALNVVVLTIWLSWSEQARFWRLMLHCCS